MPLFFFVQKGQLVFASPQKIKLQQTCVFRKHWPILEILRGSPAEAGRGRASAGEAQFKLHLSGDFLGSLETSLKEY